MWRNLEFRFRTIIIDCQKKQGSGWMENKQPGRYRKTYRKPLSKEHNWGFIRDSKLFLRDARNLKKKSDNDQGQIQDVLKKKQRKRKYENLKTFLVISEPNEFELLEDE